jgi:hypothetical protein
MMAATDLAGLTGVALTSAIVLTSPMKKRSMFVLTVTFAALWLPVDGLPLAAYLRGMVGDLSITTLLLAWALFRSAKADPVWPRACEWCLAATAAVFYPLALGVGPFDPYRWGYGEPQFLSVLLALAVFAHGQRLPLLAPAISLAILAWAGGFYESTNLWDYLLDPLAASYALLRSLLSLRRSRA